MAELTRRYIVVTMAAEGPFDVGDAEGVFVLKPWKDPAALAALEAYRQHCYPELGRDLEAWIAAIRSGPVLRGGVGARNEPYAAGVGSGARPARAARAATGASERHRPSKARPKPRRRKSLKMKRKHR